MSNHVSPLLALLALALLLALSAAAVLAAPARMIGWRGDGTGVFPDDCRPPASFSAVKGDNLAWKVPLPNFGSNSPIVVGKKAFVVCNAGWPEGADCALLLCIDAETGKELWRRELDEFATMPEAKAKEARAIRTEYWTRIRRLNNLMWEYQTADADRKAAIPKDATTLGALKATAFDGYSWGVGSAEQCIFNDRAFGDKLRKVCGYSPIIWSPTCLDINMPTPVSDGKRIFVYTGRRTVFAFDLDGNLAWQVWQSDAPYNYHWPEDCANSPLLVDGLLLMYVFDHLWAYDMATGELRWKTQSGVIRHGMGTPVVCRLPIPGEAEKTEACAFTWTGDLIRVRDGRKLLADVTKVMFGAMATDGRQMLYAGPYLAGNVEAKGIKPGQLRFPLLPTGGAMALRFALADPDTATVEQVWTSTAALAPYPILHDGKLYTVTGGTLDDGTGKPGVAGAKGKKIGEHGMILAGGRFYGLPDTAPGWPRANKNNPDTMVTVGVAPLATPTAVKYQPLNPMPGRITDPEQLRKAVAMTGFDYYKGCYGWHQSFSTPFASGNRLFVRDFDYLYCFGDPKEPFVPSKAFEESRP
jgi:outer membrane protein assembly factor BamB